MIGLLVKLLRHLWLIALFALIPFVVMAQNTSNSNPPLITTESLYDGSYALVIGVSKYKGSTWSPLNNVIGEAKSVAQVLKQQGFKIIFVPDPDGDTLASAFKTFFAQYGRNEKNRLVIFYSGHGHTIGDIGYLVPTDAPDPNLDETGFLNKALSMRSVAYASTEFRARHALFIFDSCFSGAIFSTKSIAQSPMLNENDMNRYIKSRASLPIRQFITAGNENEKLPQISQFTPLLVRALNGEVPEIIHGGFITSRELGHWLERKLHDYNRFQSPRSGTILDANFDRGDIFFQVTSNMHPDNFDLLPSSNPSVSELPDMPEDKIILMNYGEISYVSEGIKLQYLKAVMPVLAKYNFVDSKEINKKMNGKDFESFWKNINNEVKLFCRKNNNRETCEEIAEVRIDVLMDNRARR